MQLAAYIHIPFCDKKCGYCSFFSFKANAEYRAKYINSLIREIVDKKDKTLTLKTIYIGGGNPALLEEYQIKSILEAMANSFTYSKDIEITIEMNIENATVERAIFLDTIGVNRLSIGVQSFLKKNLQVLKRTSHRIEPDIIQKISKHISNINIDLIYAIPGQTINDLRRDIQLIPKEVSHVSFYGLTVEKGTKLYKQYEQKEISLVAEDLEVEMLSIIEKELKKQNLIKYEISNYAKPGLESKHNLMYWHYNNYVGFGVAAVSTIKGIRYEHTNNIQRYNASRNVFKQVLTKKEQEFEYIMMNLRLVKGIHKKDFNVRFNVSFEEKYKEPLKQHFKYFKLSKNSISLTNKGLLIYNEILADFIV